MKLKKLVSLLLVGSMVLGLAACGNSNEQENPVSESTTTSVASSTDEVSTEEDSEPNFAGTEIEVWGINKNQYTDITTVNHKSYWDLAVVAMMEWCEANGVTLKFAGDYKQDAYIAAVSAGEKPDVLFVVHNYPSIANLGLVGELTEEGAAAIAEIAGQGYLDALQYKGKYYGMLLPTNGYYMCYYNKSLFDQFGVKTPKEYWLEGNWNYETFVECLKAMTKDLDGDGTNDIYGTSSARFGQFLKSYKENEDGNLESLYDTDEMRALAEIIYNGSTEGYLQYINQQIAQTVDYPRPALFTTDCEIYNLNFFYNSVANGEYLEVVPIPKMNETCAQSSMRLSWSLYKTAVNDNEAATEAMMAYVQECCLKYMSEVSMGAIECEYEGMRGTCDISALFLERHATRLEEDKALMNLPHYDAEYVTKVNEYMNSTAFGIPRSYAGVKGFIGSEQMRTMPAATAMAELIESAKASAKTYNDTYVY